MDLIPTRPHLRKAPARHRGFLFPFAGFAAFALAGFFVFVTPTPVEGQSVEGQSVESQAVGVPAGREPGVPPTPDPLRPDPLTSELLTPDPVTFGPLTSDPVFQISNLLVKGTGQGSAGARARAIELAQIAGLRTIVDRLTSSQDRFSLRLPGPAGLTSMIEEIKIKDRRLSETSLVALLDMRFSKQGVKAYLAGEGISFSLAKSKPVLVIPVLHNQGTDYLWDDRSPWFRIWKKSVLPTGLIRFSVPEDEQKFDALYRVITSGDRDRIRRALSDAKAGAVLVTRAGFETDANGTLTGLQVLTRRYGSDLGDENHRYSAGVEPGERPGDALAFAAKEIATAYNNAWRDRSATQIADEIAEIRFESPIDGLDGWLRLETALRGLGLVERIDLIGLDDKRAEADIRFNGSLDQLSSLLATQGFDLLPSVDRFILLPQ